MWADTAHFWYISLRNEGGVVVELIKEDVFRKQIGKSLSGGYLFFGDEDYLKSAVLRSARAAICPDEALSFFNDVRFEAIDYSPDAILNAMMAPPMMTEQKIVTVSGLDVDGMRPDALDDLFEVLSLLPQYDYTVLILVVPAGNFEEGTLPKRPSKLLSRFSEVLTPVWFEAVTGARLAAWVGKHFEHHGVLAPPAVCARLISVSGNSMFTLSAETEKLSYYVLAQGRSEVTIADVEEIAIPELSSDTFAMTNALLDGRPEDALRALEFMKFHRVDPIVILGEISRSLCDLLLVKALQEDGATPAEIGSILGIRSDYKVRLYLNAASGKSRRKLSRAVELCSEADLSLKQNSQGYQPIERLICSL